MTKIPQRYVKMARNVYLCVLTAYTLLREVVPLQAVIGSSLLSYGIFGIGLALVAVSVAVDREYLKVRNIWILAAFIGVCVLSMVINFRYELVSNVKAIGWLCIFFFLLFPGGAHSGDDRGKEITVVCVTSIITLAALIVVSLPMYFFDVDYSYDNFNAAQVLSNQGFSSQYVRLWGVFRDPNMIAIYLVTAMAMTVYLFLQKRNRVVRTLLVIAGLIMLSYIILASSRTAQLVSLIVCGWAAFYLTYTRLKRSNMKRLFFSGVSCVSAMVLCLGVFFVMERTIPYAKKMVRVTFDEHATYAVHQMYDCVYKHSGVNVVSGYWNDNVTIPDTPPEIENLDRTDTDDSSDISNGRFRRWKEGLRIFLKTPLFGTSPRGISAYAKEYCPETYIAQYNYSVHSGFMEVLVGTGMIGFALILLLLIRIAAVVLSNTFKKGFHQETLMFSFLAMTLVCCAVLNSDLFFNLTFGAVIFWISIGAISGWSVPKDSAQSKQ